MFFSYSKLYHSFLRCGKNLIHFRQCSKKVIYDIKIGKVTKSVSLPKNPHLVPVLYLQKNPSEALLNHLLWIMKKDILGQDMFLIGSPGRYRARAILQYLEMMQREVEYVVLSRDTTENDLKQRREICDGTAHYIDQSAVRAAIEGSFLILDGIEKVERNVLPVLNNLLENREMQLEDGRFLIAPDRYDKLMLEHSKEELDKWKLVRVSEDFRVVALGLPVPQFKGNPLDPPFRSRFQARHLKMSFEEQLSEFSESFQNIQKDELERFLSACHTFLSEESSNLDLPRFPIENLFLILNILNKLPGFPVGHTFKWLYPYQLILPKIAQNLICENLQKFSIQTDSAKVKVDVSNCPDSESFTHQVKLETKKNTFTARALGHNISVGSMNFVSNVYHNNILADLCLTHLSHDFCIVGNKGSGKGTIVRKFASLFNYPMEMVMLYNDMTARDLLQQRITDEKGNTLWRPSQVVQAAKEGKLLVLDGLHRIHSSTLSVLQGLVHDREIQLYDGTKFLRSDRFDALKNKLNLSNEQLEAKHIMRIHPAFRIVALAEPPKIQSSKENWLNPQVLSLFLFHEIRPLNMGEEKTVIKTITNCSNDKIDLLLNFTHKLRNSKDDVLKNVSTSFSTRQLVRMARRLEAFPHESIYDLIKQSCLFEFLPQLTKQGVESVLESCSIKNPKPSVVEKSIRVINEELNIGNTKFQIYNAGSDKLKVPNVLFYNSKEHTKVMEAMLQDFILGEHLLLVGNQGVGKNKITDRFLQLINRPREYIQLHRDTTVQSLTQQPTVQDGRIVYEDSPLLKAVKFGRVLVVDEADKAPTHVTSILKALVVSGEMSLSDGRCIIHHSDQKSNGKDQVVMHPNFRMIVLANRPGFPFLGNDFFSTLGDIFSCHAVENPSLESEVMMLQQYGPNVPENYLRKLANLFAELRSMSDAGLISYPYSTREVVNIIKHLNKFPEEGIPFVLKNVFDFDVFNSEFKETLSKIFIKHGIPFDKQTTTIKVAKRYKLPQTTNNTEWVLSKEIHSWETKNHKLNLSNKSHLPVVETHIDVVEPRATIFSEQQSFYQLPLKQNDVPLDIKATSMDGSDILYVVTANPFSIYRINTNTKLMSSINLSGYFPNIRSGYKPEIYTSIINSNNNDLILLHEKFTNQTFLVNIKENIMNRININSLFDEAISKLSNMVSNKANQFFELCEFPNEKKVILFHKNGKKIILLNFEENSTHQLNSPDDIYSIHVKDEHSLLINCEKNKFFIDLSDLRSWKARLLQSEIDEAVNIKTIMPEGSQSTALMSSSADYACLVRGSFLHDDKLKIIKFPREDINFIDFKRNCIMPHNQQIIRFVHELPSHIKNDGSQNDAGFLEIVDLKNSTYTYIDANIPFNSSSFANWLINTSKSYLLMCLLQNETLMTIDVRGCIRKWETSEQSLVLSFEEWRRMIGADNEQQLTIERIDNKEVSNPKHGKTDPTGAPHVGGNTWAGGTGGRDTAGLGGRGGPYRLDAGHNVYQVPDYMKDAVPEEVRKAAREMNRKAFKEKLKEIEMSEYDAELYGNFLTNVENQVKSLRVILDSLQAKSKERQWLRNQTSGEFDDTKLIEGITGEKSIYKKRGLQEPEMGSPQDKPKLLRLVVDVSGSMYRFNGHDHRLERELECVVLLMEALENYDDKFQYEIVGHSGEEYCYKFSKFGHAPKNRKERLNILRNMIAHSQFCASGDNTLEATDQAIKTITEIEADEYFVIVMSDANFDRYGISPRSFAKLLVTVPKVNAFAIFIGSLGDQAMILKKQLPAGRGFVCFDSSQLTQIMQKIFTSVLLRD